MAKFAFIVPPLTGHINPTLSLGAGLLGRGHEVAWISLDASLEAKLPAGGKLLLAGFQGTDQDGQNNEQYLHQISQKVVYGIESVKFLYDEVLIPLNRYMFRGIIPLLERYNPDLVIHDHQLFAGAVAAYQQKIPYATSVTAPAAVKMMDDLPKVHEWEVNKMMALQQELGVQEERLLACSGALTLVFTSKDFFGEMELPGSYQFVGPVVQHRSGTVPFNWEQFHQLPSYPKVLVSIGTTFDHQHKKEFFSKVSAALGNELLSVIVVSDPGLFDQWPSNFLVTERVPQLEILPHLDAVVCHGGHNTVSETLLQGLPMVVIPIAYDQSQVAGRVVQVGSGLRLNFKRFRAEHLQTALWEVLNNPSFREAAGRIRSSFEQAGGVAKAALLLEAAIVSS